MKRKKQLLSWILSFLMVFSIMPMISITALAAPYDMSNIHVGNKLYPSDVIQDSNNNGIVIIYFKDPTDSTNGVSSKDITTEAGKDATILSLEAPSGYVLDGYIVNDIIGSSDIIMTYRLIAEWKKVNKIACDMTNITVSEIDVDGEEYDIDGQTSVTSGSSVTITIAADTGYTLPDAVTVEMGGNVLENLDYEHDQATGIIEIGNVTGDVKITAGGVLIPSQPGITPPTETSIKKRTHGGGGSNNSTVKSEILIVELTEEAIINALKTSDYKKIQVNVDNNPNLLLSNPIIDALAANKDKTLIIVSNNVSTDIRINEKNEMQFTRNGNLLIGFVSVFNAEYYLNYNGIAQKGWVQLPGETWYYFDKETGIKAKGWINDNGTWYYSNSVGVMQTGWINDSGTWYYLSKSGAMLANTTIDGYVLGASGAWIG